MALRQGLPASLPPNCRRGMRAGEIELALAALERPRPPPGTAVRRSSSATAIGRPRDWRATISGQRQQIAAFARERRRLLAAPRGKG